MASELLKTFEKIENGRQLCVNALKEKKVNIESSEISFGGIASHILGLEDLNNEYFNVDIPINQKSLIETDPDLQILPKDWPEFKYILKSKKDIVINDNSYYPVCMLIFSTDLNETEFLIGSSSNAYNFAAQKLLPGQVQLGVNTTSKDYNKGICVETIDGHFFELNESYDYDNFNYMHTWDNSKNIVLEDGTELKWIIIYRQSNRKTDMSSFGGYIDCEGVALHEAIATEQGVFSSTSISMGGSQYIEINGSKYSQGFNIGIKGGEDYKRLLIISPITETAISHTKNDANTSTQYIRHVGVGNPVQIIEFEYEIFEKQIVKFFEIPACTGTKILKTNSIEMCDISFKGNIDLYPVIYLKAPYVYKLSSATMLRYLEINPEEQLKHPFYWQLPSKLKWTNLFENIKTVEPNNNTSSVEWTCLKNTNFISFENLENLVPNMFYGFRVRTLALPKITNINYEIFSEDSIIERLILPEVDTIELTTEWLPGTIKALYIPKVTDLSAVKGPSNFEPAFSNTLLYLYAPSAIKGYFSAMRYLWDFKVGTGYKYSSITLYSCAATRETLIQFFEDLADVTEETTTYTITVGSQWGCNFLKSSDIKILTDKGWVVKFSN